MSNFYDGTKLLTLKDLEGNTPEIYMCVGNRTAGKTYYFKRMLLRRYLKTGSKFCVLVRYSYEISAMQDSFFKDVHEIDYPDNVFGYEKVGKDLYTKLLVDGECCGYIISLNSADMIKKISSTFVDVDSIFFDEFQSEIGKYAPDEIKKFMSVHISIARGGGSSVRYVPVYMCSNTVSILNPYFAEFGIAKRLQSNTKYLRGHGWVLEQCYLETASKALKESGFIKAFSGLSYSKYATNNVYLLDNHNFIHVEKCTGQLYCVITDADLTIGVWQHDEGFIYCSKQYDKNFYPQFTFKTSDHNINKIMVKKSCKYAKYLKEYFDVGLMIFESLEIKNSMLDFLGIATI